MAIVLMLVVGAVILLGWLLAGIAMVATLATMFVRVPSGSVAADDNPVEEKFRWRRADDEFLRNNGIQPWHEDGDRKPSASGPVPKLHYNVVHGHRSL